MTLAWSFVHSLAKLGEGHKEGAFVWKASKRIPPNPWSLVNFESNTLEKQGENVQESNYEGSNKLFGT